MAEDSKKSIFDVYNPDSPVGTEFFRLFHSLVKGTDPEQPKSYLITSSTLGEGKSTVAALLAVTLANLGKKTLIVDCDLRRPAVHEVFGLYLEDGVTEVSDRAIELAKAYKQTAMPSLFVLTAGRLSANPSTFFEQGKVTAILTEARPHFDFVIIDCAPVMPVVDPIVLAPHVTGVLMVVKAGETHRELAKQAVETLKKAGAPMAGVLLNNAKNVLPYHYSYRYSYEYYSSDSSA